MKNHCYQLFAIDFHLPGIFPQIWQQIKFHRWDILYLSPRLYFAKKGKYQSARKLILSFMVTGPPFNIVV